MALTLYQQNTRDIFTKNRKQATMTHLSMTGIMQS